MNMITRLLALPALVFILTITPNSVFAVDDGTYKTVEVKSSDQCQALCSADNLCRGWTLMQPDTRFPDSQCSLNNGIGEQSPFPIPQLQTMDLDIALAELNVYRKANGLEPLALNDNLTAAAQAHSDDLAAFGNAAHEGSDGSLHDTRVKRQGYEFSIAAENVATGQENWDKAFKAWQDSPGHDENLLRADVTELGIAQAYKPGTTYINYWTMVLAAPL